MWELDSLERADLVACLELGKALTGELDAERLVPTILERVSALLPAQIWSLLRLDPATGELIFEVGVDLEPNLLRHLRLKRGEGIAGQTALRQEPMVVADVTASPYFSPRVDRLTGLTTRSVVCLPLVFGGRTVGVLEVINPERLEPRTHALLGVAADYLAIAVENTQRYRRIEELARRDPLTGLFNTRYLYRDLENLARAGAESGTPFSLVFLDLDHFKQVVDTHGHLNGSQTLKEVAQTLRQCLDEPSYGVSYGGDEFVAVLPGVPKAAALAKAEEIRTRLADGVYLVDRGLQVRVTASLGVAAFPEDAGDPSGLLALADQAMFWVKGRGKNAVHTLKPAR